MSARTIPVRRVPMLVYARCDMTEYQRRRDRADHPAEGWLYGPGDLQPIPGGAMCERHAQEIIQEYLTKLGEEWSFEHAPDYSDIANSR